MSGPPPKPTHLKLIEGNPGKRKLNPNEPIPPGRLRNPPPGLTASQKAGWDYAISNAPLFLLRRVDRAMLKAFVIAEDIHAKAGRRVAKEGLVTKAPSGAPIQNPYLAILNKQAEIMRKLAAELGFTPASRSRIEVPNSDPLPGDSEDEADEFFGRGGIGRGKSKA